MKMSANSTPTTTECNPVRAPSDTPAADSTYAVAELAPKKPPLPATAKRTFTEHWMRHGEFLTVVTVIDDVHDERVSERTGVERLPARGRIEGGLVEQHVRAAVHRLDADDGGVKRRAVRLGVVEAMGHESSLVGGTIGSSKKKMAPPDGEVR